MPASFATAISERPPALQTAGGRVLAISARGPDLASARERAYAAAGRVSFEGRQLRGDIGVVREGTRV